MMKVIIVDDERIAREGLRDLVDWNALGLEVACCAANGEAALEWMEQHGTDIVITDIKMPKMDGLELLAKMSERGIAATTIILSGFNDFKYAQKAIQYGVLHYLLKPVHMEELQGVLQRAVEERQKGRTGFAIAPEEYARFRSSHQGQADELMQQLTRSVCQGATHAVEGYCSQLKQLMDQGGYSLAMFKKYAFSALYQLMQSVGQKLDIEISYLEDVDRLALLSVASTGEEAQRQMCQCAETISEYLAAVDKSQKSRVIEQMLTLLQHRYADHNLSLNTVADEMGMTPNYLSSLFKGQTGQNFSAYLEQLRIEKACMLLKKAQYKVYEVADAVGYRDARHFAKVFKASTGKTPLEYRNQIRR